VEALPREFFPRPDKVGGMVFTLEQGFAPLQLSARRFAASRVPGDYTGRGRSDLITYNMLGSIGFFSILNGSTGESESMFFGQQDDYPIPADYDGNGVADLAVFRANDPTGAKWVTKVSDSQERSISFGAAGDTPAAGDFDCDGKADRTVIRSVNGGLAWYSLLSSTGQTVQRSFGLAGDKTFIADLNADGCDEMIVSRVTGSAVTWYYQDFFNQSVNSLAWGLKGDSLLTPADFDGDGSADLAVARAAGAAKNIYIRHADGTTETIAFGLAGDIVVSGFFSGVNRAELAVYRWGGANMPSTVYFRRYDGRVSQTAFGFGSWRLLAPDGSIHDPSQQPVIEQPINPDPPIEQPVTPPNLGCQLFISPTTAGVTWTPVATTGKSRLTLPKTYYSKKNVKSVYVYDAKGRLVDIMGYKKVSRSTVANYNGNLPASQLQASGVPITFWMKTKSKKIECLLLSDVGGE
jgi:hypothetical protein